MAYDERELLARLIQCEAGGEGEIGMKAVAGVVMNRVNVLGGEYQRVGQGSLQNIVFRRDNLFAPVKRKMAVTIRRTFTICALPRKTMILPTGLWPEIACRWWGMRCGFTALTTDPAEAIFPPGWGSSWSRSADTAFMFPRTHIMKLE